MPQPRARTSPGTRLACAARRLCCLAVVTLLFVGCTPPPEDALPEPPTGNLIVLTPAERQAVELADAVAESDWGSAIRVDKWMAQGEYLVIYPAPDGAIGRLNGRAIVVNLNTGAASRLPVD